ncbi:MAG: helicase [Anaerolineae bacterium]|nr:helicase [Anaerolineae bacterium]
MMRHDIVDNRSVKLLETIKTILPTAESAKFAVGYFFLSGLEAVEHEIAGVRELRLLIGSAANRQTIEQIAEGYRRLAEIKDAAEALAYPRRAQIDRAVAQTAGGVGETLAAMDQTDQAEALVSTLVRLIQEERLQVRVYTRGRLHAKAYIFDYPADRGYEKGIAVVGSSNFTLSGVVHNTELNVVVGGNANHAELTRWFEELWAESEPFDAALMEELDHSWAREPVTPYEIYLKTLYELVRDRLDAEAGPPVWTGEIMGALTDFQLRAVERAIRMIRQHGGCFVADVVGLGKSYIGAAIIKHFERTERARPLVICPAPLVENWEHYNEAYQLNARVLSMGMLREGENGHNILLDDIRFKDRDFVLVDESHNFRSRDTQRWRVLEAYLAQGRRCVLLTATPRNKSVWDIFHQLKLFHPADRTDLPIDPPDIREYTRLVEAGERSLPALLANILIRRTRNHILRWYGYDAETDAPVDPDAFDAYRRGERRAYVRVAGQPNFFPRRVLQTVEYNIEATYRGLYGRLRAYMGADGGETLTYARYGLWRYVRPAQQNRSPYVELQRAGANLRGLMRVSMFKRLESSVYAFRATLRRQLHIHKSFLAALDRGVVAAGEDAQTILYESDRYDEVGLFDALDAVSGRYDIADFDADALRRDVEHDARIIETMLEIVEAITPDHDAKLQTLLDALRRPPLDAGKRLIFTQYADTADYLHKQIVAAGAWPGAEVIHSDRKGKVGVVGRFAPKANPDFSPRAGEAEINLLVATDVLSEGLNLQDCDKVVNYDLHWNPVRLIQRFGRIDRIGSAHDTIYGFNFLPETALDAHLGLRERLAARIREIHATIGEDAAVLDPAEQLNESAMYAIYEGRDDLGGFEDDREDELVDLDEAEEIIRQLERDNPALFARITALRDGVRCARRDGQSGAFVFCRAGDYRQLYLLDEQGEVVTRDLPRVLGRLRCEPDARPVDLPGEYNHLVTGVKRAFEREVRSRRAESTRALAQTGAQKYVARELSLLYGQAQEAAQKAQAQALAAAFSRALPRVVHRQLNAVRRQNLSGELLAAELMQLYERYDLGQAQEAVTAAGEDDEDAPRIVCSEAFCL